MSDPKFKTRSFTPDFIDEIDAAAADQARKTPGAKPKSTPEMLAIAWQFYKDHNYGKE